MVGWGTPLNAREVVAVRVILALALLAQTATAGPKPGETGTPEYEKAAALNKQLGHPRFAVREAAGKQLLEMGAAAIPALTAGTKSADEEVRARSLVLLPQARAADWKRRADAYLAHPDRKHDLPLLAEWEKLVGKPDAGSRRLFAEMLRADGDLLDRAAADPGGVPDAVKGRCREVLADVRVGGDQVKAPVGDLAALFFLHHRIGPDRPTWVAERAEWESDHPAHLLGNPGLTEALGSTELGPAIRRLVTAWAGSRPADDQVSHQCFCLAVHNTPFPEAVPVLIRLAKDSKAQPLNVRAVAIDALGRIGDGPARAALADLVTDHTPLSRNFRHRVGDHALATLLLVGKKDPADYGLTDVLTYRFRSARRGGPVAISFRTFPDDEARQRGLRKWKDETAKKDR